MAKNNGSKYSIGYKKPPRHTQFKPGQSGNAKGRPKKSPTLVDAFLKELGRSARVTSGTTTEKLSMTELIAKQIVTGAAKGNLKSASLLLSVLKPVESNQGNNLPELLQEFREKNARHVAADGERNQVR